MNNINKLSEVRSKIDSLDDKIVPLLVARIELALQASTFKNTREDIKGKDRVKSVLDKVKLRATNSGGHELIIQSIYSKIISELTELQLKNKGL